MGSSHRRFCMKAFWIAVLLCRVVGSASVVEESKENQRISQSDLVLPQALLERNTVNLRGTGRRDLQAGGTCGGGNPGNGVCANGQCCSQYGWCGTTVAHCDGNPHSGGTCGGGNPGNGVCASGECCSQYGWCGMTAAHCAGNPPIPSPPSRGTCGGGNPGNGVCANGECCSQYGWCGTSSAHCAGNPPGPSPPTPPSPISGKVIGGYYPNWVSNPIRPQDLDPAYNLVYIFHAVPGRSPGTAIFREPYAGFDSDVQVARQQGRKMVLSFGGANAGESFDSRSVSDRFLQSITSIIDNIGGVDGLDWNNFEGGVIPSTTEMIYISQRLKQIYPGFLITAPPAPWRAADRDFAQAMNRAGVLDYIAPQWYDGPGLTNVGTILNQLDIWTHLVGQEKVVVGLGVRDGANYMSSSEARSAMQQILGRYPNIRGAFQWEVDYDMKNGRGFARSVAPLLA